MRDRRVPCYPDEDEGKETDLVRCWTEMGVYNPDDADDRMARARDDSAAGLWLDACMLAGIVFMLGAAVGGGLVWWLL